jgi:hypothetical protein
MAFDHTQLKLIDSAIDGTGAEWVYTTTESLAACSADGYFYGAGFLGVLLGDQIFIRVVDSVGAATVVSAADFRVVTSVDAVTGDATASTALAGSSLVATPVNYGAFTTGADDASDAILATEVNGYTVFQAGNYRISKNITLVSQLTFMPGAYLTIDGGVIVTIKSTVEAGRQQIFRGAGTVSFVHDEAVPGSEESRSAKFEWFGVETGNTADQSPMMQKCFDAMGNIREGVVEADEGNYRIDHDVIINRATLLRGQGTRRTAFNVTNFAGVNVFKTGENGCRFQGFQFENQGAGHPACHIWAAHPYTIIEDVGIANPLMGVRVTDRGCRLRHIQALGGDIATAGSCLISVEGVGCYIDDVYSVGTVGPESIISVGSDTYAVSDFTVHGLEFTNPSIGVLVKNTGVSIQRGSISNIRAHGAGLAAVRFVSSSSNSTKHINVSDITCENTMTNGVMIDNSGSTATISHLNIAAINMMASAGAGISIIRSAGIIDHVHIGLCDLSLAATPIYRSGSTGSMTNITIDPQTASPARNPVVAYDTTIGVDSVYIVDIGINEYSGFLIVTAASTNCGQYVTRAATTPAITATSETANMAHTTGVLTGTTGTSGKITVSVDAAGLIYVENRTAGSIRTEIIVATGIVQ